MIHKLKNIIVIAITLVFINVSNGYSQEFTWKNVDYIIDGDTFVAKDGSHIRLLGINTTETGKHGQKSQLFADEARLKLTELIFHKKVRLEFGDREKDRYGRLLAHIYTEDGTWINAALIKSSLAHVYSFPDNRAYIRKLIKIENKTKKGKKGLWSLPRWQTYKTRNKIPDSAIGKFNIIEGKVHHTTKVKDKLYINFGANWRTDFSVEIPKRYYDSFKQAGINIKEDYNGKTLQIRGIFKPVNGVLITVTHPEQLTILN